MCAMEPVYGRKDIRLQRSSNNRLAMNSLKVVETEKVGGLDNSLMCTRILEMAHLSGLSKIQDFLGCSRSPGRSEVEHWPADKAVSGSRPLVAEIFPSANETSLYTSSLSPSYHPDMTKILLKKTQNCKLFKHQFLAIPCIIMVKTNRALLKISAYPSVR